MRKTKVLTKRSFRFLIRIFVDFWGVFTKLPQKSTHENKRRILIFNWRDTKHAFAGGAEVYIHELAKRWVKDGNEVTLFCGSDGKSKRNETIDGVRIIRRGGFYFVYVWALLYYLFQFRGKFDVIIDCENGIPFFTPLYTRCKTFLVIHHVHQEIFRKNLRFPFSTIASFLEGKIMPFLYRNIQIITVSPSSKKEILTHKLTRTEPKIIYNGIDRTVYTPGEKAALPLVVYLGRLQSYKSLHVLLQAAEQVVKTIPNAKFIIAGTGEDKDRLVKLTKKLKLTDHVHFTGRVTEQEKIALLRKAWLFVNPSLREGWGITTIEANACRTPVIASRVSGLKDSIKHGVTGYLLPYGDVDAFATSITKVLKEAPIRKKLSDDARTWSESFSWDASANNFTSIMAAERRDTSYARTTKLAYYLNKIQSRLF